MSKLARKVQDARENLFSSMGVPGHIDFVPDPFQLEAIESVLSGSDTLVSAPTGTGKTYIATEAIEKILRSGKRAIYTAPLKALSNTKFAEFRKRFEPEFCVGLLTGDRRIDTDAHLVVATTEIYRNDLFSMRGDYGMVVLDELHYLADPQRGPVWEESIILSPKSCVLLMLSASISNSEEVAQWIGEVRGKPVNVIKVKERAVELRLGFLHPQWGVIPLQKENRSSELFSEVSAYYGSGGDVGGQNRRPSNSLSGSRSPRRRRD